ncbi:HGL160Cp [Eremothecium sinecaudum]|uniref:Carboxypeptidase n=1 Tax=Eremothecium sinecaudum TaxID=45286 RepID=A0A0X8HVD3_9SACH|nr:HGL160Cp [Eremothecium sinecaudum]AMD22180.1 HGL160Cp [Eremothecium sinecaudum]
MVYRSAIWCLLAFTLSALALPNKDEFKVASELLPGISSIDRDLVPEMYAGQLALSEVADINRRLFFWRFSEKVPAQGSSDTLILWLNGGPGCSSMDGALLELGPFRVNDDGHLYPNPGSWHTKGDILFVDQPAGAGFSELGNGWYLDNLNSVTTEMITFLTNYYTVFPEDRKKKLIIAGESYAGQYIPYLADGILSSKKLDEDGNAFFPLESIMIGNGWIDPQHQSLSYLPFLEEKGIITSRTPRYRSLLEMQEACRNSVLTPEQPFLTDECNNIFGAIIQATRDVRQAENRQCINIYDYTLREPYPSCGANWPPGVHNIPKFFQLPGVKDALHITVNPERLWEECNVDVFDHLTNPKVSPAVELLPKLLNCGLEILLFNGENDVICNNLGVEALIANLTWQGETGFSRNADYYDWVTEDATTHIRDPAGFVRRERGLTFVSVYNASHMVPINIGPVGTGIFDISRNHVSFDRTADNLPAIITVANGRHPVVTTLVKRTLAAVAETLGSKYAGFVKAEEAPIAGNTKGGSLFKFVAIGLILVTAAWAAVSYSLRQHLKMKKNIFLILGKQIMVRNVGSTYNDLEGGVEVRVDSNKF